MATIQRFEDLRVWKTGFELAEQIYSFTDDGPFSRDFGLRDQMRRASVSVMSNVAEGFESQTQKQFISFLYRAKASAGELRAQLYLARELGYITSEEFQAAIELSTKASNQCRRLIDYLYNDSSVQQTREPIPPYGQY